MIYYGPSVNDVPTRGLGGQKLPQFCGLIVLCSKCTQEGGSKIFPDGTLWPLPLTSTLVPSPAPPIRMKELGCNICPALLRPLLHAPLTRGNLYLPRGKEISERQGRSRGYGSWICLHKNVCLIIHLTGDAQILKPTVQLQYKFLFQVQVFG